MAELTQFGKNIAIRGRRIALRGARPADAGFIFALRSDESRNLHISAIDGSAQDQRRWIDAYLHRPAEWYFVIESEAGVPLGAVRIYDLREASFCWGSWVLSPQAPAFAAIESALLIYEFAFHNLGFPAAHFDVRKENQRVLAFHRRFGARDAGQDADNFYFTYARSDYERVRERYAKYLPAEVRVEIEPQRPA